MQFAWIDSYTIIGDGLVSVVGGAGNPFAGYGTCSVPAGETSTGYATATLMADVELGTTTGYGMCWISIWTRDMHWYDFTVEPFMVVPETVLGIGVVAALLG
ncbi:MULTISPECIES: hypothetical protein [Candidatus Nitrosocaldus]|jgi:hypothetical protein|uniref:Uncharacterized protein n=1 Tax=Candidatus Nitrosocaldus cavascurensis TaxID=2058097 RepID=A0A2K5ATJ3_9ARCH|nr:MULTISPECIES: hypothetical protein [Candidatus Nitrosocaldus]GBC74308.1 hypothetical protein HRbin05_00346 [archaeon HR05]SPC34957.1 protein of unknown function [Candidatus Nitrosocaldus cavascurensis]